MKSRAALTVLGLSLSLLTAIPNVMANETIGAVTVERNQAVIQVKGVVCSFCAYGTEKALSKLSFLDKSQFGNDGVLMNIHTHRITLALQPGQKLNVAQVYDAIIKGGYDPTAVYVNLHGQVQQSGNSYLLTNPENGQVFDITGNDVKALVGKGLIQVKGHMNNARSFKLDANQPIPVIVTSVEVGL
ncbi:MAG: hypothetical protein JKY50_19525 [Oleispira sp.]|nr:hypothetical protein [Oleispira sp.]MBL4880225.1 hypothetical protein [Oleispira sp.]